jgi:hypothetical protein
MHWAGSGIGVVAVVLGMLGITVTASATAGLEPGVHVDPGSPAAKEYALPLNQARRTGAAPGSSETAAGALFGAGIKPPGGGSGAGGSHTHAAHGGASSQTAPGDASASSPHLTAAVLRAANGAGGGGGDGSLLALIGGGVAILILGGFGGTVLRHSRRPSA